MPQTVTENVRGTLARMIQEDGIGIDVAEGGKIHGILGSTLSNSTPKRFNLHASKFDNNNNKKFQLSLSQQKHTSFFKIFLNHRLQSNSSNTTLHHPERYTTKMLKQC